jgi:hypothetical protein
LPLEGGEPGQRGLAISADGSTAYVSFRFPDGILVFDLRAGRIRASIDISAAGLGSVQAVLSADGKPPPISWLIVVDTADGKVRR